MNRRENMMTLMDSTDKERRLFDSEIPTCFDLCNVSNDKDYYHDVINHDNEFVMNGSSFHCLASSRAEKNDDGTFFNPPTSLSTCLTVAASLSEERPSSLFSDIFPPISFQEVNKEEYALYSINRNEEDCDTICPSYPPEDEQCLSNQQPSVLATNELSSVEINEPVSSKQYDDADETRNARLDLAEQEESRTDRQKTRSSLIPRSLGSFRRGKQLSSISAILSPDINVESPSAGRDRSSSVDGRVETKSELILPEDFVPGPWSIVIGKDKKSFESPGNQRLRVIVRLFLEKYAKCGNNRSFKSGIISEIVTTMMNAHGGSDRPGAFIKYKNGRWWEVGVGFAREKISRMLRECLHTQYTSSSKQKRLRIASSRRDADNSGCS